MPIFTTSIFLLSGLAIVVPIALHLLHRRKPQPMLFGAVRFLRDAIARSRRSRRLTQGLTLLMRCLILLLLAFGFSRPMVRQSSFLPEGRRCLLLVLDGSGSMQAREGDSSLFVKGQQWIGSVLDDLTEGDLVGLLVLTEGGTVEVIPPVSDHEHVRSLLDEASCGDGGVDLAEGIRHALDRDEGRFQNFELHVFSDFQHGSWEKASVNHLGKVLQERQCAVFLNRPAASGVSDAGVIGTRFTPAALAGEGPYSCTYTLGHSEDYTGSLTVRLVGEGKEQDQLTAVLPGSGASDTLTGYAEAGEPGVELTGKLVIDADSYALNDCQYYSLARLNGQPALVVNGSGDSRDSFFLRRALKPGGGAFSHVDPVEKDWAGLLNTSDLSGYAMVFVCNPPALEGEAAGHLRRYVEGGGMLVLFPGGLNGMTEAGLKSVSGYESLSVSAELLPEASRLSVFLESSREDVFGQRLEKMLPPPWEVSVRRRLQLRGGGSWRRFLRYSESRSSDEFMLRCPVGKGELYVCSLSANRDWSDLPLTPFYFVLVQELSRHGAGFRHRDLSVSVGGELRLAMQGSVKELGVLSGRDGAGRKVELQGILDQSGKTLVVSGFHSLGIYTVEMPWGGVRKIAVNLPESERSLARWGRGEMEDMWFSGLHVVCCDSLDELRHQVSGVGRRHPVAPWLLLAAFALSMFEVLYANIRSRHPSQPKLVDGLLKSGGGVA